MSRQFGRATPAMNLLMGMLLFSYSSSLCFGQPTEEEVVARIIQFGGRLSKDEEGKVRGVNLISKTEPILPLLDKDIESIDFSMLPRLTSVSVWSPKVTDRSLVHLRKIPPGLRHLGILGAPINDRELVALLQKHKFSLTSLELIDTAITDRTLSEIGKLEKLLSLSVHGTKITDRGLRSLAKLENLAVLDLGATKIADAGLAELTRLTDLSVLVLEETKVTDAGILQLQVLKNLKCLCVSSTKVTEDGKRALQQLLPDLEFK